MLILLPGCLVQSCRLSSCKAFVPLERLPMLLSGKTTVCIAKVSGVRGAAPLQAANCNTSPELHATLADFHTTRISSI